MILKFGGHAETRQTGSDNNNVAAQSLLAFYCRATNENSVLRDSDQECDIRRESDVLIGPCTYLKEYYNLHLLHFVLYVAYHTYNPKFCMDVPLLRISLVTKFVA